MTRIQQTTRLESGLQGWLPIYDTLHGIRGEINITVKVDLFCDANKYRVSSVGMQLFYSNRVPDGYNLVSALGFTEELIAGDDPEFHWMDRIRTPRASNEARQALFARFAGQLQRRVGLKALELGGNAVLGYQQYFDLEGDTGIVVRGIGSVVKLMKSEEDTDDAAAPLGVPQPAGAGTTGGVTMVEDMAEYPFITIRHLPPGLIDSVGGVVSARSVKLLDNSLESEAETRDSWWTELRKEIRSHAKSLACNIVVGYQETTTICEDVLLLSASGTAALLASAGPGTTIGRTNISSTNCGLCHAPYRASVVPFRTQLSNCGNCQDGKVPDVLFATIEPSPGMGPISGSVLIQARVCEAKKDLRGEASAREISDNLPFLEYELHKQLLAKMKKTGLNAVLGLNVQVAIGEHFVTGVATGTACVLAALPRPSSNSQQAGQSGLSGSLSESEDDDMLSSSFKQRLCIMNRESNGKGDDTAANAEVCITRPPPPGFTLSSTETCLGPSGPEGQDDVGDGDSVPHTQLVMQTFRVRLHQLFPSGGSLGASTPPPQLPLVHQELSRLLDRGVQSLFVRLRKFRPCRVLGLHFRVAFPQADEMQATMMGTVMYGGRVSGGTLTNCTKAGNLCRVQTRANGVEISTLSSVPGRAVSEFLGNVNFFLIRETSNLTHMSNLNSFAATFLQEVLAIARCHVAALGGDALLSFRMDHQLLLHGAHKHQGQCLVSVQGDAVLLEKLANTTNGSAHSADLVNPSNFEYDDRICRSGRQPSMFDYTCIACKRLTRRQNSFKIS
ncbi:C2 domain-containing protein 5-like isoform X3 [Varroa destructor]|uniref:Uncharacterized protein n=1 Tax=Varroa destructor TaxID=109461 RepID=A0A7M7JVD1_VARDE|nr:C2 domain-containing protein 5-like isoform X3 [Varroa destructor]